MAIFLNGRVFFAENTGLEKNALGNNFFPVDGYKTVNSTSTARWSGTHGRAGRGGAHTAPASGLSSAMASGLDYFGRGPTLETAIDALERFESEFDVESPVSYLQ